ncbi:MAG: glycosyltransferase [Balneolaceae bacterium]|nr:glycosyltransferase [Balneolaceae bacterium]
MKREEDEYNAGEELPTVSIIIPFFNNTEEVDAIVDQITGQNYPGEQIEIICIDNGSSLPVELKKSTLSKINLIEEKNHPNSPYSARNRGIEASTGEIIVFIDANSWPDKNWLRYGVNYLLKNEADIVAGRVDFDFEPKATAAKLADALTSLNMKMAVEDRGAAYTANIFVKKEVFEKTGFFEENVRSGGDVRWTLRAKEIGFKIMYCGSAVVYKKARDTKALYRKKIRTGRGYFYSWRLEEERTLWFYNFFRSLKPPDLKKKMAEKPFLPLSLFSGKKPGVWFHLYLSGIVEQVAFIMEFLKYNLGSQRDIDRRKKMMNKSEQK